MIQHDFIGEPSGKPFRDIRNMRPTTAEDKAQLVLELHGLCLKAPDCIRKGSIEAVRNWMELQKWSCKVAANPRSSVPDLERAIRSLRNYL